MKLISLGKVDKKFIQIIIVDIIIILFIGSIDIFYFRNHEDERIKNELLNTLIIYGSLILFGIPEYIIRKKLTNTKIGEEKKEVINDNKIIYIFKFPYKKINIKILLIAILLIMIFYIYLLVANIFEAVYLNWIQYISIDYLHVIDILYLYLIYRLIHKTIFYKHQILSLILVVIMEFSRYLLDLFLFEKANFENPKDLISFIPLILYPLCTEIAIVYWPINQMFYCFIQN